MDFVPRSPLNVAEVTAKANCGRSSLGANHTTSLFLVMGFGSYSAKLLAGTRHPFPGLSHMRECGDDVFRMLATGRPPARCGGSVPHRINTHFLFVADVAGDRREITGKYTGHRCEIADVAFMRRNSAATAAWLVVTLYR